MKYLSNCNACPLWGRIRVLGDGNPASSLVFVGQCPGPKEAVQHKPFVGPSGIRLMKLLTTLGLCREAIWLTNVIKCVMPPLATMPKEAVSCCWPNLVPELEGKQLIVAIGRVAADALKCRLPAQPLWGTKPPEIFELTHPAAALRNTRFEIRLQEETRQLKGIIENGSFGMEAFNGDAR